MLNPNSLAASPWVISFFLVFFNATSRSLSAWVISSCPSCIPKAWGCQDDISTLLKDDILILLPQFRTAPIIDTHVVADDAVCCNFLVRAKHGCAVPLSVMSVVVLHEV